MSPSQSTHLNSNQKLTPTRPPLSPLSLHASAFSWSPVPKSASPLPQHRRLSSPTIPTPSPAQSSGATLPLVLTVVGGLGPGQIAHQSSANFGNAGDNAGGRAPSDTWSTSNLLLLLLLLPPPPPFPPTTTTTLLLEKTLTYNPVRERNFRRGES